MAAEKQQRCTFIGPWQCEGACDPPDSRYCERHHKYMERFVNYDTRAESFAHDKAGGTTE